MNVFFLLKLLRTDCPIYSEVIKKGRGHLLPTALFSLSDDLTGGGQTPFFHTKATSHCKDLNNIS